MGFKKNVGLIDRILRAVFGTGFIAYGLLYLVGVPSLVFVLIGLVLIVTAFTGRCPAYSAFGISTCGSPYCDVKTEEEPMAEPVEMAEEMPPIEIEKPPAKKKKPKRKARKRRKKK
jgi:hypothetical protein